MPFLDRGMSSQILWRRKPVENAGWTVKTSLGIPRAFDTGDRGPGHQIAMAAVPARFSVGFFSAQITIFGVALAKIKRVVEIVVVT